MKPSGFMLQMKAEYEALMERRIDGLTSMYIIALLIAANDVLKIGPKRSGVFLQRFLEVKEEISRTVIADVGDSRRHKNGDGDADFWKTKNDLAKRIRPILGEQNWLRYRDLFPVLRDYYNWEDEPI